MDADLRFPIGTFVPQPDAPEQREAAVAALEQLPSHLRAAVAGLSEAQLDTPYRPDGWTVRQLVHHIADSHMNALIRFKLALTEDNPTVKPYDEKAWALLPDARLPIAVSLPLIDAVHARMVAILRPVTSADAARSVFHPEHQKTMSVGFLMQMYAWHGRHHVAHITALRQREGW